MLVCWVVVEVWLLVVVVLAVVCGGDDVAVVAAAADAVTAGMAEVFIADGSQPLSFILLCFLFISCATDVSLLQGTLWK